MDSDLFPTFHSARIQTATGSIFVRFAGEGPPVVLLHGFPQTHVCWHRIAPALSSDFAVVCMDLKGYGASTAPPGDGRTTYSKRVLASDVVTVMRALGHARFSLVGHDRGARVGYRLALDQPSLIERLALLDIVPTNIFWEQIRAGTFPSPHWSFLARPAPEPEDEIGRDPAAYFEGLLAKWSLAGDLSAFDPRALAAYRESYMDPAHIHAFCEDYRAGATADVEADDADLRDGIRLHCPSLLIWSDYLMQGKAAETESPPAIWRRSFAPGLQDASLKAGHFIAEEDPAGTLSTLRSFLAPLRAG
jgi:haloacetate dehalogenase